MWSSKAPTPTGLCVFDIFDCRGDHRSSVIYKNIIVFCADSVFNVMLPLAPSERGLPRKRVEEPAKQETVRLF